MSDPQLEELDRRLTRLEQLVAQIAKQLGVRSENPSDKAVLTDKPVYDWQRR